MHRMGHDHASFLQHPRVLARFSAILLCSVGIYFEGQARSHGQAQIHPMLMGQEEVQGREGGTGGK
jgi:hypothetical protein